jgi:hypothetical protein
MTLKISKVYFWFMSHIYYRLSGDSVLVHHSRTQADKTVSSQTLKVSKKRGS